MCAGSSAVLDNAIRSRVLSPYSATDLRLADVEHRRRLLQGQSILVGGKKGRKETKQQYMFLVQALGPSSMSRVSTAQQAREALLEGEQAGRRFDWLYIDKSGGSVEEGLLQPLAPQHAASKKRKRAASAEAPARAGMGVLTNELVIQSLILGRMVEPGEMDL